jgi:hypothetical protein
MSYSTAECVVRESLATAPSGYRAEKIRIRRGALSNEINGDTGDPKWAIYQRLFWLGEDELERSSFNQLRGEKERRGRLKI